MADIEYPRTRRENEIWQACDDLWAQYAASGKITGDAIRDQLVKLGYKKGSPNEIYKFRRSWKSTRGINDTTNETDTVQSDPISRAVSLVYEQIHTEAQQQLDQTRTEFEQKLDKSDQALIELKATCQQLAEQKMALAEQLASFKHSNEILQRSLADEQQRLALALERQQTSERLFEQYRIDSTALVADLKAVQEQEINLWRNQADENKTDKERTLTQLQNLFKEQWHGFSEQLSQFRVEIRNLNEAKDTAQQNHIEQKEKCIRLRDELKGAQQELVKQNVAFHQLEKRYRALETKYTAALIDSVAAKKIAAEYKKLQQKWQRDYTLLSKTKENKNVIDRPSGRASPIN